MHSRGFRICDPQQNVMSQSTEKSHLFLCFLDIPKSLEIFNENS